MPGFWPALLSALLLIADPQLEQKVSPSFIGAPQFLQFMRNSPNNKVYIIILP